VAIWGNHSATQFPDYANALINGKPAAEAINDQAWLQGDFLTTVQKRGAAIIDARGLSSAASAANAAIDSVVSIRTATPGDDFTSLAVVSNGEYGIPEGLQFGFPVRSNGSGWTVVEGLAHDEFASDRIRITTEELEAERADVAGLLP
jgi:malate dehydrogenase